MCALATLHLLCPQEDEGMEVDVGEFGNAPELLQPKHEGQSRIKDRGLSALYPRYVFLARSLTMSPDPYWSTNKTDTHIPYKTHL